ncbi:MAG: hypothetical protein Q8P20_09960 [bacterium]|nr:hypothetical protein [bacterium]
MAQYTAEDLVNEFTDQTGWSDTTWVMLFCRFIDTQQPLLMDKLQEFIEKEEIAMEDDMEDEEDFLVDDE